MVQLLNQIREYKTMINVERNINGGKKNEKVFNDSIHHICMHGFC